MSSNLELEYVKRMIKTPREWGQKNRANGARTETGLGQAWGQAIFQAFAALTGDSPQDMREAYRIFKM